MAAGFAHQGRQVVVIVYVGDVEIGLCAFVWWSHVDCAQKWTHLVCGFQIEVIVAYQAEYLAIAIYSIVAKHLLGHDVARPTTLVGDVLYKVRIACHIVSFLGFTFN